MVFVVVLFRNFVHMLLISYSLQSLFGPSEVVRLELDDEVEVESFVIVNLFFFVFCCCLISTAYLMLSSVKLFGLSLKVRLKLKFLLLLLLIL